MSDLSLDLHIGVHKTATTFIQKVFQDNAGMISASGLALPPHRQTRKGLTIPCQLKAYERIGQDWNTKYTDDELRSAIASFLAEIIRPDTRRILLSDENLVGHCGHIVKSGILYNRKQAILSVLKDFLPVSPGNILFAYRDYAAFFSSVYCQYLIDVEPQNFVTPQEFGDNVLRRGPSWFNFSQSLLDSFPGAKITCWAYEDVSSNWPLVLTTMLGAEVAGRVDIGGASGEMVRRSMSGRSFAVFLDRLESHGAASAIADLRSIRDACDADRSLGQPRIFTAEQESILQTRYGKHCQQLQTEDTRITVLF